MYISKVQSDKIRNMSSDNEETVKPDRGALLSRMMTTNLNRYFVNDRQKKYDRWLEDNNDDLTYLYALFVDPRLKICYEDFSIAAYHSTLK